MKDLARDFRLALRMLPRSLGFTITGILTLGLGIACSMIMFAFARAAIQGGLPSLLQPDRVVTLWSTDLQTGIRRSMVSIPEFLDWRARSPRVAELGAFASKESIVTRGGTPLKVATQTVSANFFHLMGASAESGRTFVPSEELPGAPHVALVSEGWFRAQFGGDTSLLGQTIRLDGIPYAVVGITPRNFWYPARGTEIWTPLVMDPGASREQRTVRMVGRLQPGVTLSQAQAALDEIARTLEREFPNVNGGQGIRAVTVASEQNKRTVLALAFGLGPAIIVLLIACANVSGLLLARGFSRQTEFATRAALGATRIRMVRQMLAENFLLTAAGAVVGIIGAYAGLAILRNVFHVVSQDVSEQLHIRPAVLLFAVVVGLVLPLLFGLAPALRVSRVSLNDSLRAAPPSDARFSFRRLPPVVLEVSLTMVLLLVSVLFGRSLIHIERALIPDVGFRTLVEFRATPAAQGANFGELLTQLAAIPGVAAAGVVQDFPLMAGTRDMERVWVGDSGARASVGAIKLTSDGTLLSALRLRVLQGKPVSGHELTGAVVSESFARRNREKALGLRVWDSDGSSFMVTGVVADWLVDPKTGLPLPTIYLPLSKLDAPADVLLRVNDPPRVIPAVQQAVRRWNHEEPAVDCKTLYDAVEDQLAGSKLLVRMIGVFGLVSLLLASVGIYGIMNYSTTRRVREMGIRIALGATRKSIVGLVLRDAMLLIVAGLLVGWPLGAGSATIVGHELAGVTPLDPITALVCCLFIAASGLLASYFPARRAANADPMDAIRSE